MVTILALWVALGWGLVLSASATPILDFGILLNQPASSTISYVGGAAPLVGTDIVVTNVVGIDTPLNNGAILTITGGLLNFTTGNYNSGLSSPSTWYFDGGPLTTIKITGGISTPSIPAGSTLLTGQFDDAVVLHIGGPNNNNIVGADFSDAVYSSLLSYFGLTGVLSAGGNLNIDFNTATPITPPNLFTSSQILGGNVTNTYVPITASSLLLGSGLLGMAALGFRRRKG
jgi:hypothetical protein